jgi:hypothetical protein
LGTLPPTSPLPARIRGNYLVSVATDEADVPVVVVYRIRRS